MFDPTTGVFSCIFHIFGSVFFTEIETENILYQLKIGISWVCTHIIQVCMVCKNHLDAKLEGHTHFYLRSVGKSMGEALVFAPSALIVSRITVLHSSMLKDSLRRHTLRDECVATVR